jgi:hypothetical protein
MLGIAPAIDGSSASYWMSDNRHAGRLVDQPGGNQAVLQTYGELLDTFDPNFALATFKKLRGVSLGGSGSHFWCVLGFSRSRTTSVGSLDS